MDAQAFNKFLENRLEQIRLTLAKKGDEYVPGTAEVSRFHNFEVSAALNDETLEKALWGFVTKHIVSLSDMVKKPSIEHPLEQWEEKIGDVINYMILLQGIVTHQSCQDARVAIPEAHILVEDPGFGIYDLSSVEEREAITKHEAWLNQVTPPVSKPRITPVKAK